jgi:hypothetical protein
LYSNDIDKPLKMIYNVPIRSDGLKFSVKEVMQMKNALKKLTAIAMAFTIIGAGTTFTKALSPDSDNTLTANAEIKPVKPPVKPPVLPPIRFEITTISQWVTATIEIIHVYLNGIEIGTKTVYHG